MADLGLHRAAGTRPRPAAWAEGQRGHRLPWVPVLLGTGICGWFALRFEPGAGFYAAAASAVALALLSGRRLPLAAVAVALLAGGLLLAGARAHWVAGPVLGFRYYGPVEGRVVAIDRSASGKVRVTLDRVRLEDVRPARTPARVRLSLHGEGGTLPRPGLLIGVTAHLSPPSGPVEPGGFDFRRKAWFERIGAVGYARAPPVALVRPEGGMPVFRLRRAIAAGVMERLEGDTGTVAAALLTGDRAEIDPAVRDRLRATNLAHLLAISGLHMGLLTGVVFGAVRFGLALVPAVSLRVPAKRIAAGAALAAGAGYYLLSGGSVATERAFVMVAVALGAVMLDRRAITLRAVAVAACVVLVLRPEAVTGPGFQMSFAATTALVAAFGAIRGRVPRAPGWAQFLGATVFSSAVAGLATAPFAAAHFNIWSSWGLVANLLSVPVMGAVVMPCAVAAAVLWPLGLEGVPLWIMGAGIDWILFVAEEVASWEGAVRGVPAPPPAVLPLVTLGGLALCLWQGRGRLAGLAPVAAALMVWMQAERPPVLIAEGGGLVGAMTPEGRALSRERGDGFAGRLWLENDGDRAGREVASARLPGAPWSASLPDGGRIVHLPGIRGMERLEEVCREGALVVTNVPDRNAPPGCTLMGPEALRRTGAIAWTAGGPRTAAEATGPRLWVR
ncbi:competence protein ComEC [Hasllibacter halocynthiae]|uniref:Competence protein ComEC n=1 Tax=Hasllibacter halocynthiae TaxID=595589 RepID=A0A2T0X827_9RHOB|nr:ComEC/Rec2 family competence protein [Hasllibacter halocynthiae]PRY95055.1 competence protein ComEC [Hasllibacter halocynthiae]